MPAYDAMLTPDLKLAMAKIGARPVGKKRMRELLTHVYRETHQYETDSDYEGTPLKRPRLMDGADAHSMKRVSPPAKKTVAETLVAQAASASSSDPTSSSGSSASGSGVMTFDPSGVMTFDPTSADPDSDNDSNYSDGPDLPEESILQV